MGCCISDNSDFEVLRKEVENDLDAYNRLLDELLSCNIETQSDSIKLTTTRIENMIPQIEEKIRKLDELLEKYRSDPTYEKKKSRLNETAERVRKQLASFVMKSMGRMMNAMQ